MRTNRYELMRPEEFIEARNAYPVAFLPVGPLEWHGPHMPFGTDALDATRIAQDAAAVLGGVVFPTLYCGTERARDPENVRRMGFEDGERYVVGMDVPNNTVPSLYFPEEVFGMILREQLRQLMKLNFKLIVVVNAHGADGQLSTGARIAREFSHDLPTRVLFCHAYRKLDAHDHKTGHANICETSMQMYLNPDSVRVGALPPREVPLKTCDWGIADGLLFQGLGNDQHTVENDPRDASAELGRRYIENNTAYLIDETRRAYAEACAEK